jgi:hypothetical protein
MGSSSQASVGEVSVAEDEKEQFDAVLDDAEPPGVEEARRTLERAATTFHLGELADDADMEDLGTGTVCLCFSRRCCTCIAWLVAIVGFALSIYAIADFISFLNSKAVEPPVTHVFFPGTKDTLENQLLPLFTLAPADSGPDGACKICAESFDDLPPNWDRKGNYLRVASAERVEVKDALVAVLFISLAFDVVAIVAFLFMFICQRGLFCCSCCRVAFCSRTGPKRFAACCDVLCAVASAVAVLVLVILAFGPLAGANSLQVQWGNLVIDGPSDGSLVSRQIEEVDKELEDEPHKASLKDASWVAPTDRWINFNFSDSQYFDTAVECRAFWANRIVKPEITGVDKADLDLEESHKWFSVCPREQASDFCTSLPAPYISFLCDGSLRLIDGKGTEEVGSLVEQNLAQVVYIDIPSVILDFVAVVIDLFVLGACAKA